MRATHQRRSLEHACLSQAISSTSYPQVRVNTQRLELLEEGGPGAERCISSGAINNLDFVDIVAESGHRCQTRVTTVTVVHFVSLWASSGPHRRPSEEACHQFCATIACPFDDVGKVDLWRPLNLGSRRRLVQ